MLAKLDRAHEHIEDLKSEINEWVAANSPVDFRHDVAPDGSIHVVYPVFDPQPDFYRWGVIAGDVLHNLRSGLDHLAWTLVKINGGKAGYWTGFPVLKDEESWRAHAPGKLAGVSDEVFAAIEEMQPYKPQKGQPERARLRIIHDLNIADKHKRLIPVVLAPSTTGEYTITPASDVEIRLPLKHETVFMAIKPHEPTPHVRVQLDFKTQVAIEVRPGVPLEVGQLMALLRDEVAGVFNTMLRFFLTPEQRAALGGDPADIPR